MGRKAARERKGADSLKSGIAPRHCNEGISNFDLPLCSHKPLFKSFDPTFSKSWRVWAAPTKTPFLFDNFFFAAHTCKEKVGGESDVAMRR
ncbi:MAG: hypothetical protein E7644_09015 [Ruminococcaceae bacterium]|nr:hypothetical protein [Oscillospiraceae bacterium]